MNKTRKPLDLTTCSITSGLIRFSLPFLASSILQTMYSTVDTIIVGQFCGSAGTGGGEQCVLSLQRGQQYRPGCQRGFGGIDCPILRGEK